MDPSRPGLRGTLAWAEVPAKLFYTSQTDFTDITLTLKKPKPSTPSLSRLT